MDVSSLIGPAVVAALVSGAVAIVGYRMSAATAKVLHSERLQFDKDQAERKFEFDKSLAQAKFDFDRAQLIHERRFELAESLLADAYRARDILRVSRSQHSFETEGKTRRSSSSETDRMKELRDNYFIPVESIHKEREFLGQFFAKRYSAASHFGEKASECFDEFFAAFNYVQVASHMLIASAGFSNNEQRFLDEMQSDLWIGYAKATKLEDRVETKINSVVAMMEALCRPALEWKGA